MTSDGATPDPNSRVELARRVLEPFWRALVGFRILALVYAAGLAAVNLPHYRAPGIAVAVLVGMGCATAVTSVGYLRPAWARRWVRPRPELLAALDVGIAVVAVASTVLVDTPERIAAGAPVLPTVWVAGAPVALGLARGALIGTGGAVLVQLSVILVRGYLGVTELTDLLLMLGSTLAIGYSATSVRQSADRLRAAVELRAAVVERERLARSIHDGVLQVLAQVRRRGETLTGPGAELAALAGEQEVALRNLISSTPSVGQSGGRLDLAAELRTLATPRVSVATPAEPVSLPTHVAREMLAATRTALANVDMHVGPEAPAWVLLEERDDAVVLSVRDNGPGVPEGRFAAAEAEGRMGVSRGIRGRIADIGGTARCITGPGLGCEWNFEVPRS